MNKEKILQNLNLTKKQAKLYLTALSLGPVSISQLAKKADLKRPTAYLMIDELIQKGLVSKTPLGKRTHYKAESPKLILEQIEKQKNDYALILPELQNIYTGSSKEPRVRFYEGKKAIQEVSEEIWRAKEIWAMFSVDNFLKHFKLSDNKHFFNILIRNGGVIYDILENTPKAKEFAKAKYRLGISEARFLPDNIHISTDIQVWDDKVSLISFENLTATIIEDESIAQTQRQLLKLIWNKLPC